MDEDDLVDNQEDDESRGDVLSGSMKDVETLMASLRRHYVTNPYFFEYFVKDKRRKIFSFGNFRKGLSRLGIFPRQAYLYAVFEIMDRDEDGRVTKADIVRTLGPRSASPPSSTVRSNIRTQRREVNVRDESNDIVDRRQREERSVAVMSPVARSGKQTTGRREIDPTAPFAAAMASYVALTSAASASRAVILCVAFVESLSEDKRESERDQVDNGTVDPTKHEDHLHKKKKIRPPPPPPRSSTTLHPPPIPTEARIEDVDAKVVRRNIWGKKDDYSALHIVLNSSPPRVKRTTSTTDANDVRSDVTIGSLYTPDEQGELVGRLAKLNNSLEDALSQMCVLEQNLEKTDRALEEEINGSLN